MGQGVARGPVVRGGGSHVVGAPFRGAYYRPYYRGYYGRGYGYGYGPRFSIGFYAGYPFYGYGYYGYPYPYYPPYPYYGYPYGYPSAGYPYAGSSAYPGGYGYGSVGVGAYSGVRIQGAPPNAEVFADGTNVGIVDDFDSGSQRLELTPGAHSIEIHAPGMAAMVYDVNVQPGRTVTLHVR